MLQEMNNLLERETTRRPESSSTSDMTTGAIIPREQASSAQPIRPGSPTPDDQEPSSYGDGELQTSVSTWNLLADQPVPARGEVPTWPQDSEYYIEEHQSMFDDDEWCEYETGSQKLRDHLQRVAAIKALKRKCSKTQLIEFEFDNTLPDWEVAVYEDEYDQLPDKVPPALRRRGSSVVHEYDPHYRHKIKYDLKKTKMIMSTIAPAVVWRPAFDEITTLKFGDNVMKRVVPAASGNVANFQHRREMIWSGSLGPHPLRKAVSMADLEEIQLPAPKAPCLATLSTTSDAWRPETPWTLSANWADDKETEEEQARFNAAASAKVSSVDLCELLRVDDGIRPGSELAKAIDAERNATFESPSSLPDVPSLQTHEPVEQGTQKTGDLPAYPLLISGPAATSFASSVSSFSSCSGADSFTDQSSPQVDALYPLVRSDLDQEVSSLTTPRQSQSSLLAAVLAALDDSSQAASSILSSKKIRDIPSSPPGALEIPLCAVSGQLTVQHFNAASPSTTLGLEDADDSTAGCFRALQQALKAVQCSVNKSLSRLGQRIDRVLPPEPKNKLRRKRACATAAQSQIDGSC